MDAESETDHHFAIVTFCEILGIISQASSLSSDLLRDLERQKIIFSNLRHIPDIDQEVLLQTIHEVESCIQNFSKNPSKSILVLNNDVFLNSIRKRFNSWGLPFGSADFPTYYHWLNLPSEERRKTLQQWSKHLIPLAQSMLLLLKILRESGSPSNIQTIKGSYEQPLPENKTYHFLRIKLDKSLGLLPEISASPRILMVQLMRFHINESRLLKAHTAPVNFELTLCGG